MDRNQKINPKANSDRGFLKVIGGLLTLVGGGFLAVGMIDFFASFGRFGMPTKFWCCFVGMPLLGIGIGALKFAFMGKVSRYVAGETAPVVKDTVNYMAQGTRDSVRDLAAAVREGVTGEVPPEDLQCPTCTTPNDFDASFCKSCGAGLSHLRAPIQCECGGENDYDASFCNACGNSLSKLRKGSSEASTDQPLSLGGEETLRTEQVEGE